MITSLFMVFMAGLLYSVIALLFFAVCILLILAPILFPLFFFVILPLLIHHERKRAEIWRKEIEDGHEAFVHSISF